MNEIRAGWLTTVQHCSISSSSHRPRIPSGGTALHSTHRVVLGALLGNAEHLPYHVRELVFLDELRTVGVHLLEHAVVVHVRGVVGGAEARRRLVRDHAYPLGHFLRGAWQRGRAKGVGATSSPVKLKG